MQLARYQSSRIIFVICNKLEFQGLPPDCKVTELRDDGEKLLVELDRNVKNLVALDICGLSIPISELSRKEPTWIVN